MIGAPPAQDEQARMSGARGDFVASLPRRLEVLRGALRAVEDQPRDTPRINGFLRRLHALGSAARVLGFASVAEALGEAEKTLRRVARAGPAPSDLAEMARALDLLPSLVLGAKVSIRAAVLEEAASATSRDFPVSVLLFGAQPLVDALQQQGGLRIDCERTDDPVRARELSRVFGPDVAVIDADLTGARDLIEVLAKDPMLEPIPIVVVGDFSSPELSATFIGLGAARVLPKPVSPDALRRTVLELRDQGTPSVHAREPLGELNVNQLVDRIAIEVRRGLVEAVEPAARSSSVSFGEGTDVMSAVWGAVARLRELVTLRSDGNVRFEPTGPEGAVPLAPWNDDRRVGERGAREGRAGDGVSLQGRRIVVADDDPAVVWFLGGILRAVGAEVFEAHDGERAFELTAAVWPDLVVSDVLMPKLDGFALCHEIKRDVVVRDVPVILLSWKEDLLQRVRELGGDADGYLRKEAAASTVVERLREVLRPRARVEQRVASGGEVRGRLDGLTPRLVLELACRSGRDMRVTIRDSSYSYEVQVRASSPRMAIRSASDGSFERGERVLSMLLGVSAGRFVIEADDSHCRSELSGSLHEQLAGPVARARAAQRAVSAGALASVTRVVLDPTRVGSYLDCTPEPARALLRELIGGASPRDLLTSGAAPARLLEALLSDFARRGAILLVETVTGVDDISKTNIPPLAGLPMQALVPPTPTPAVPATAVVATAAPAAERLEPAAAVEAAPPVSQRRAPAVYSQPHDAEEETADAGWFSFQIESSAVAPLVVTPPVLASPEPPPVSPLPFSPDMTPSFSEVFQQDVAPVAPAATPAPPEAPAPAEAPATLQGVGGGLPAVAQVTRHDVANWAGPGGDDPLRKTLSSTAPPRVEEDTQPGASVSVERGHRPDPRMTATLGSAGNEAAAALAALADEANPLEQALLSETPSPPGAPARDSQLAAGVAPVASAPSAISTVIMPWAGPAKAQAAREAEQDHPEQAPAKAASPVPEPVQPVLSPPGPAAVPNPWRAAVAASAPKAPAAKPPAAVPKATASPAPAPAERESGGVARTLVLAALAAGVSFAGVRALANAVAPQGAAPLPTASSPVSPGPVAVAPAAPALLVHTSDSPLDPSVQLPQGNGLLEVRVPEGTAIRVDGEYLGMGPARRIPLPPGPHQLTLGDGEATTVSVKPGMHTLATATPSGSKAPAGPP